MSEPIRNGMRPVHRLCPSHRQLRCYTPPYCRSQCRSVQVRQDPLHHPIQARIYWAATKEKNIACGYSRTLPIHHWGHFRTVLHLDTAREGMPRSRYSNIRLKRRQSERISPPCPHSHYPLLLRHNRFARDRISITLSLPDLRKKSDRFRQPKNRNSDADIRFPLQPKADTALVLHMSLATVHNRLTRYIL